MPEPPVQESKRSSTVEEMPEQPLYSAQDSRSPDHLLHETAAVILRYSVFVIMEAAFTSFAWYCYARPRPLPFLSDFKLEPMTVKSAFITAFTLWHTVAVAGAFRICADTFSREWAARPNKTDAVSVITSGILDRVLYFFHKRATKTYRLALAAFLGILLLHTTAPSTITASFGLQFEEELPIGRISTSGLVRDFTRIDSQSFIVRLNQAAMAVRLEQLAGSSWGLIPQPNWLIPLPFEEHNVTGTGNVIYNTDLVSFNYSCEWQAPGDWNKDGFFLHDQWWNDPDAWEVWNNASFSKNDPGYRNGSSILQIVPTKPFPNNGGYSAYILFGGNSSFPVNATADPNDSWINLDGLPTSYLPGGYSLMHPSSSKIDWVQSPLATLFVCDPHLKFSSGRVVINPTVNASEPDVTIQTMEGIPPIGNIQPEAASFLFSTVLHFAIGRPDTFIPSQVVDYINFNSVGAEMFLVRPRDALSWRNVSAIHTKDAGTIEKLMNDYTSSGLKAFTGGYKPETVSGDSLNSFTADVRAKTTSKKFALATSYVYAILHSTLFGLLSVMLGAVVVLNKKQNRTPFDLAHVTKQD